MAYTVKKLAALSGVSTRMLHFYDEIGLLKPAYYGENHYRYYEEKQLLLLQQILFFRRLGFPLSAIQRIISNPDFDQMTALMSHRKILVDRINHTQTLIETIDKTIAHLRGKQSMNYEELFAGFNPEQQHSYEKYLLDHGVQASVLQESKHKTKTWTKKDWETFKREMDNIHHALVEALNNQLKFDSAEVQLLINKHYEMITKFWTPTKETYIGLSELYCSHPDFIILYQKLHPELLNYLVTAMKIYAEKNLT